MTDDELIARLRNYAHDSGLDPETRLEAADRIAELTEHNDSTSKDSGKQSDAPREGANRKGHDAQRNTQPNSEIHRPVSSANSPVGSEQRRGGPSERDQPERADGEPAPDRVEESETANVPDRSPLAGVDRVTLIRELGRHAHDYVFVDEGGKPGIKLAPLAELILSLDCARERGPLTVGGEPSADGLSVSISSGTDTKQP